MSVSAEVSVAAVRPPEQAGVDVEWLEVAGDWYEITPEPLADRALPKFSYDLVHGEYAVNVAHPQAPQLARMVLQGAVDHDKVVYSELDGLLYEGAIDTDEQAQLVLQRRVAGKLIGLVDDSELQVVGVAATDPRALFDSLDAYTRLPQLSIADRELAHAARREFIDFQHEFALQGVIG